MLFVFEFIRLCVQFSKPLPLVDLFCSLYFRRFGTKCAGCLQGISPSDLVRRARNKVFHLKCFTCMICRKELSTGEELYIMDENRFICKEDYLASKLSGELSVCLLSEVRFKGLKHK